MSAYDPQMPGSVAPRVLVVEDSPTLLELFVQLLGQAGYDVMRGVRTGEEAIERIEVLRPDLILMDVALAGALDGIETAQEINAHYSIPIVYLTAYSDEATLARAVRTGPYGYLVKPVDLPELRRAIEVALVKHTMQQEMALSEGRYRRMFEAAAVSLWEEDMGELLDRIEALRAAGVSDFAAYLVAHPEFVEEAASLIRVIDVNRAGLQMFGATDKSQLLGTLTPHFVPEAYSAFRDEILAIAQHRSHIEYETVAQTLTGETRHILVRVTLPQAKADRRTSLTSIMDITERVRAEAALRDLHGQVQRHAEALEQRVTDRTRELATLYAISEAASRALDLETMLDLALKRTLEAVPNTSGCIHLIGMGGAGTEPRPLSLAVARRAASADESSQSPVLPDPGVLSWIASNDAPLVLGDTAAATNLQSEPGLAAYHYVGMPMRAGGQMVGVLSVFRDLASPAFIADEVALLTSVADQVGAGVESARLRRQGEQAAVVGERQRLARELHDSVTQSLYSLTLLTEGARRLALTGKLEDPDATFTDIRDISLQCLKEMRLLVYELHASGVESQGVAASIQQRLDAVERRSGLDARLVIDGTLRISEAVEEALAGIAHEALNNALKHANATTVVVRVAASGDGQVELSVSDDGSGFQAVDASGQGGLGLAIMRERAEGLGGTLAIHSDVAHGTTVVARLPSR